MKEIVTNELVDLFVNTWNRDNNKWREVHKGWINQGWCYQFAILLRRLHGGELWYDNGHAWVKINGRFYDSDHPEGVEDVRSIASFHGTQPIESNVDEEHFIRMWRHGGSGEVQVVMIEEIANIYRQMKLIEVSA